MSCVDSKVETGTGFSAATLPTGDDQPFWPRSQSGLFTLDSPRLHWLRACQLTCPTHRIPHATSQLTHLKGAREERQLKVRRVQHLPRDTLTAMSGALGRATCLSCTFGQEAMPSTVEHDETVMRHMYDPKRRAERLMAIRLRYTINAHLEGLGVTAPAVLLTLHNRPSGVSRLMPKS
jgi:hypothetical protein